MLYNLSCPTAKSVVTPPAGTPLLDRGHEMERELLQCRKSWVLSSAVQAIQQRRECVQCVLRGSRSRSALPIDLTRSLLLISLLGQVRSTQESFATRGAVYGCSIETS